MDDSLFESLPSDPEEAFLTLEGFFRRELEDNLQKDSSDSFNISYYIDYLSQVVAAISELNLTQQFGVDLPPVEDINYASYPDLSKRIKNYCIRLQIRKGRRTQGFSVAFDPASKAKIHHLLGQVRETIQLLEVTESKREALLKRVAALESEVDRTRTRLEAFGELVIGVAGLTGEASEKLEPLRKLVDSVARIIHGSKEEEERNQVKLPAPEKPKQLEGPKTPVDQSDDDIPF